jgi:hypothetical protein
VTLAGNASTYVQRPAPAGKGRWLAALVGVALLAGIAGRWLSGSGRSQPATQASPVATPVVPSGASTAGALPKLVTLKIAASPSDTEILLDGAKLDENPFTGQFPKDKALHRLEARSFGRVTEARMIRLDQDLDLLLALQIDKPNQYKPGSAPAASAGAKASAKPAQDPPAPVSSASAMPASTPAVSAPAVSAPAVSAPAAPSPADSTVDARR